MSYQQKIVEDAQHGIAISDEPDGLYAIQDTGCAAAIWQRQPMAEFQSWIDALDIAHLPKARLILRPHLVHDALQNIARSCGMADTPERDILIEDAAALAAIFSDIMQTPFLRLRLDVVRTNACRKFHIDTLSARLICTYRGTGTQYGLARPNEEPTDISTLPAGSPMIMRGTLWPENPTAGFRHRSPPIEGTGETRLVLVLDPVAEEDNTVDPHFLH